LYSTIPDLTAYFPLGVAVAEAAGYSVAAVISEVLLLHEKSNMFDARMPV